MRESRKRRTYARDGLGVDGRAKADGLLPAPRPSPLAAPRDPPRAGEVGGVPPGLSAGREGIEVAGAEVAFVTVANVAITSIVIANIAVAAVAITVIALACRSRADQDQHCFPKFQVFFF